MVILMGHCEFKSGAQLLLAVLWSTRNHHLLHDYYKLAKKRLNTQWLSPSFGDITIPRRGKDIAFIANKVTTVPVKMAKNIIVQFLLAS